MRYKLLHTVRIPKLPLTFARHLQTLNPRLATRSTQLTQFTKPAPNHGRFHTSPVHHQNPSASSANPPSRRSTPSPHTSFYRTHGRALFKALTLAFFTY